MGELHPISLLLKQAISMHTLQHGIMKDGLVLFGDNTYLNSPFLATLYPNVRRGSCDYYNFYHSQVSVLCSCALSCLFFILTLIYLQS